jgi:hypothetical protein
MLFEFFGGVSYSCDISLYSVCSPGAIRLTGCMMCYCSIGSSRGINPHVFKKRVVTVSHGTLLVPDTYYC